MTDDKEGKPLRRTASALMKKSGQTINFLTQTQAFKNITKNAFKTCDHTNKGQISKSELYSGVLLVHVNLAKYAGPAACFPPTRETVSELFDLSDADGSGTIDEEEFENIMVVCCGQIFSRVLVYYALIILAVPIISFRLTYIIVTVTDLLDDKLMPNTTAFIEKKFEMLPAVAQAILDGDKICQIVIRSLLSLVAIPYLFHKIDSSSKKEATKKALETEKKRELAEKKED